MTALPAMANVSSSTTILLANIPSVTTTVPVTTTSATLRHSLPARHVAERADHRSASTSVRVAYVAHVAHVATVTKVTKATVTATAKDSTSTTPTSTPTTVAVNSTTPTTVAATPTTTLPVTTTTKPAPVTTTTRPPVAKTVAFNNTNPSANILPSPNFLASGKCTFVNGVWVCENPCVVGTATGLSWPGFTNGAGCTGYVLSAINNARSVEGIGPMVLPSNWYSLTTPQQLFVIADLERTARGLPPYLGINQALTANAQHAAQANADPSIAAGFPIANDAQGSPGMGGAWSGGFSVLAADYMWMYDDGWGGSAAATSNIACTSAHAAGCWAHRDQLLGSDPGYNPGVGLGCTNCEMGTGFAMVNNGGSFVDLIEIPQGVLPPMTFTWAADVAPYLG